MIEYIEYEEKPDNPNIEIGPVCPPIKSWVFSLDGSFEAYELESQKDDDKDEHASQPS
jgi:hypothetical protein